MKKKEIKEMIKELEAQGWRVEKKTKHYQAFSPDGQGIVTFSATPSDHRSAANTVSRLRRYGFKWKGR